ncbi:hypothetical protein DWF00_05965 [Bosea caraganae]|uniref:Uncharacterized protein n=1 Tax=Bosea caraganae TaxID=2763117 RepID=A0A370L3Q4_9HYPH|nr:hypothetical protein [Bosea caraganae]RDJ22909.1 hypothetical protein DWE98_17210 [Bosea caraganae]RDJ28689.1 hypothetical protein DWF00_05965 [Bosea caraganae]
MPSTRLGLAAALLLAASAPASALDRTVKSGAEQMIGIHGTISNQTCESGGGLPTLTERPAHGSVEFRSQMFRVTNTSSQCHGRPYRGYGIYYRSHPGFRGIDRAVISTFVFNGRTDVRTDHTVNIRVQ